jgi:hypothetical protein
MVASSAQQRGAPINVQNPGDYTACYAICVQRVEDEAAYMKAIGG